MSATTYRENETCELCAAPGGELLWEDALCRVVSIAEADYPGYCRVILNRHRREMTDLPPEEQIQLMRVVLAVETALRRLYQPDKINLASFGNMAPHVHWHVIPRWRNDRHFPNSIWGAAQRDNPPARGTVDARQLRAAIVSALSAE